MLKQLSYDLTFSTTGRRLTENLTFEKGFGLITGRNEAGKSTVLELIRFNLFGSSALRGKLSDFKKLKTSLTFEAKGQIYRVERSPSTTTLYRDKEAIASGVSPVNQKIVQILGFGLQVFDVACIANQGDIEKLGNLKPTERRRMVDSVIGLGIIEEMAKWAGTEARTLTNRISDLQTMLVPPEAPVIPRGYRGASALQAEVTHLQTVERRMFQLEAKIDDKIVKPGFSADELDDLVEAQDAALKLWKEKQGLPDPIDITDSEIEGWEEQYRLRALWERRPRLSLDEIEVARRALRREQVHNMLAKIDEGRQECPACQHRWTDPTNETRHSELTQELLDTPPAETDFTGTERDLDRMVQQWAALTDCPDVEPAKPPHSESELVRFRKINGHRKRWDELKDVTAPDPTDYREMRRTLQQWEASEAARVEVEPLRTEVADLAGLQALLVEAKVYEAALARYETDQKNYETASIRVQSLQEEATEWRAVQTALTTVSQTVKQHLIPSLNKVASYFLQQMTGGARQVVSVDHDFDILVDGQSLNTLSGSGKAVANLALRLGLGQVLTNNMFSLFIGDEIDASMDSERATNTSQTLRSLTQVISQVILVTHKFHEAEYVIQIGSNDGTDTGDD